MPVKLELVGVQGLRSAERKMGSMRAALELAPRGIVHDAAIVYRGALKSEAAVKTGKLRSSIGFRTITIGPAIAARFSAIDYASFVISGTKPHDIWAGYYTGKSGKKVLSWEGAAHPTPYVRHPGTKPNDFRKKAWAKSSAEVRGILRETTRAIVHGEILAGL